MIEAHNLSRLATIRHGFFTRGGGYSSGIYASLNCGFGSMDDPELVRRNRLHVATSLGLSADELLTVYQVHGTAVVSATMPWDREASPEADAVITDRPGIGLAVLTADCAPVLFADGQSGVIGAAHAGWRGALAGVCEATIAAMEDLGASAASIVAAVGPAISKANYEVDAGFHASFIASNPDFERFFASAVRTGHYQFDLPGFVEYRLTRAGVGSVERIDRCTYAASSDFYSYRRATHRNEADYGRQISAITLGPKAFLKDPS